MAGNRVRWHASVEMVMVVIICLHDRKLVLLIWLIWLILIVWPVVLELLLLLGGCIHGDMQDWRYGGMVYITISRDANHYLF